MCSLGFLRRLVGKPKEDEQKVSLFQASIVSTESRGSTGNIVDGSTAICIGGTACYIEEALKKPVILVLFCIFLIAAYGVRSMALINIPCCFVLSKQVFAALKD